MNKTEVEKALNGKGDFVKIDHLTRFLKQDLPIDMKKYIYNKLIEIYDSKSMFSDSAKAYNNLAVISVTYVDQIKYHIKEAESYIKAGFFDKVYEATKKAMSEANSSQKHEINLAVKTAYLRQAEIYEQELKRSNAMRVYEKLLEINLS